jgi:hypothetical protein
MSSKIISVVVGAVLIVAAITLSFVASGTAEDIKASKEKLITQYVKKSEEALAAEDIKGAIKYAKLAIGVDPKGKEGYKCYKNAMELKYKPQQTVQQTQQTTTVAPVQAQPEEEEEEEDAMGC